MSVKQKSWLVGRIETQALYGDAGQQYAHGTPVSALLPADLVFFGNVTEGSIGHAGMYAGDGNMIGSPQTGAAVQIESLYTDSSSSYAGARRYLP